MHVFRPVFQYYPLHLISDSIVLFTSAYVSVWSAWYKVAQKLMQLNGRVCIIYDRWCIIYDINNVMLCNLFLIFTLLLELDFETETDECVFITLKYTV